MKIYSDIDYDNFEFWSGARDTVAELTDSELKTVWDFLETERYPDGAEDVEINDFFWFERDFIAELLGYENFDQIIDRNKDDEDGEENA